MGRIQLQGLLMFRYDLFFMRYICKNINELYRKFNKRNYKEIKQKMELPLELCEWLSSQSILNQYDIKSKTDKNVILETEVSQQLETGLKLIDLIKRLYSLKVFL